MADAAYKNPTRKFPAYTLAELQAAVPRYESGEIAEPRPGHIAALKAEIAARLAGTSKPFRTPQIP